MCVWVILSLMKWTKDSNRLCVIPECTDSDSEFSSLERENHRRDDIYARVNRRPTPHKKKHKPRHSDSSLPPPLPPYTDDRHVLLHQDQLAKGMQYASFVRCGMESRKLITWCLTILLIICLVPYFGGKGSKTSGQGFKKTLQSGTKIES